MAMQSKTRKYFYYSMIVDCFYFYVLIRLALTDFTFAISWRIKVSASLAITGLQIELYLGDLKMNFDNLMEEDRINEFIHALVNELGVELLGDIWDYGQTPVVSKLEEVRFLQSLLKNSIGNFMVFLQFINNHISDLLKMITGGGGGEESSPIFEGVEPDCKLDARK